MIYAVLFLPDFKDSINFSPDPFNPQTKPEHGILKTPERFQLLKVASASKKGQNSAAKKATPSAMKRRRASDFF